MNALRLYFCPFCGNLLCSLKDSGVMPCCCGEKMAAIPVNTRETLFEKHLPYVSRAGSFVGVRVGEELHPMREDHHIEWIALLTDRGLYATELTSGNAPITSFCIDESEKVICVYAYCNLHGLWMKKLSAEYGV